MDVHVPEIPASYDDYRKGLRAFIKANLPELSFKPKSGLRVPDDPEDVVKLRGWVRALHDAGYASDRHADKRGDPFEEKIRNEELGRTRVPYVLGNPLVGGAIKYFGSDEQRAKYLPAISNGEHIWTQLFSEPDAGSDLASLKARATLDGDHYVVDGQKVWSTWAQFSDYGYLLARTESGTSRQGITAFILDMNSPGVTTRPLREITGTTDFNEVFLDSVKIPVENVIGKPGEGWKIATMSLGEERGGVGGGGGGDLVASLVELARTNRRGGRPAIEDSAVRQDIARFAARSRMLRYLGYRVATKASRKEISASDGPLTKVWFSELNLEIAEYGMELQGAQGMLAEGEPLACDDGRWQDMFLYARAWTIAGGSSEVMRNLIAERGLELPRDPR
jgi:alkylation response protein AidB-like acyl-CoA dehydrogenase